MELRQLRTDTEIKKQIVCLCVCTKFKNECYLIRQYNILKGDED